MAEEPEEIDLDQIVWDPRYRRSVIERLNRDARNPAPAVAEAPPRPESGRAPQR
jgi:hypothetical protein